ncbi:TetR/AcrR family transcriptional regulator [Streptomyces sp. T12]|uniref:TetR/AcrR family transcriptional regulator n=1 Tax=Streptomyces sp. T12 TaxID=477697 RepID=UPI0011A7B7F2|nr:TetR/AcrR family transcriptional regulator [Streptomyces sp. T12]
MAKTVHATSAPLRTDAARNRSRILEAALRRVEERGLSDLTMSEVAALAGVGKGTVFRHFGDRTGLLLALLDHSEQQFHASFTSGPPPLGPGAPAETRLRAFGHAVLRQMVNTVHVCLAAQMDPMRRFTASAYRVRLAHVAALLQEMLPAEDVELLAHVLMASLDPALTLTLVSQHDMTVDRVETGWDDLISRLAVSRGRVRYDE